MDQRQRVDGRRKRVDGILGAPRSRPGGSPRRAAGLLLGCGAALLLGLPGSSRPQPPPAGQPEPGFLEQYTATYRFSLGTPQAIHVADGGGPVFFLRSAPRSFVRDLYEQDVGSGGERLLASAARLLGGGEEQLSPEEKARRERERSTARGIASFDLAEDGSRVLVPLGSRLFIVERASGATREVGGGEGSPLDPRLSPDGQRVACVRGGELDVIDVATGAERRLTRGATASLSHGLAEFVAQEEMDRHQGYWWSPDSATLAYEESDTSQVEIFHIADPMHPDRPADSWPYPRPGKDNAAVRLGLVPAAGGETVWVAWEREKYPYLAAVTWRKEGPLTILVQNRAQTEERLLAVDRATGATRTLLVESDAAWLNLFPAVPRWLANGGGFLWISERAGEPRLELRGADGSARRWLTPEGFGLRSLVGVDEAGGAAYVRASPDPTREQLWRVPLGDLAPGAGRPAALTRTAGLFEAVFARDGSAAVWSETPLDGERSWSVRRRDGSSEGRLRSVAERPPFSPRLELTTLGPLAFHAAIIRPRSFQAGHKYPVLLNVYGGPKSQMVRSSPWGYLLPQWIADHGFVVLALDGRGTPARGREWERAIRGNLIDLPLADQVAGLQAAGAKYPELDLTRVGIFGWSFGGYFSAMAAMRRPDAFKAAVAGAPVCDWQDYDTHYTERYLGLPRDNPQGYRASSVLTYCKDLQVPLLIVHGTSDDNVYLLHSLRMTDALFRAGRRYEFLVLPGFTHMVPDPAVQRSLQERILAFFSAHLSS